MYYAEIIRQSTALVNSTTKRVQRSAILTMFGLLGGVASASAAGTYVGTIVNVEGYGENTNAVFVIINGTVGGSPPSCGTQNYRFVLNPSNASGQALLAITLSALARNVAVSIIGSGTCSIWGDTESILLLQSP
jgi:hypothetical protein